ncbi:MAG: vitamin K epoxide reductase family protein [Candidatus Yanofskybacteria bacterium]|nr:vitamin K epoxide reductase family protein [Candidatus Yanofskybacteria bacterium]
MVFSSVIIIFIAFSGFLLAAYIRHKKVSKETLVCPLKADCDTVIFSDYSKFFGVPVELLGMAYYLTVAVAYGVFLSVPVDMPQVIVLGIFSITVIAFLFSLYLTFVQAFALKQWCTWCLISAGFCTGIFFLVLLAA